MKLTFESAQIFILAWVLFLALGSIASGVFYRFGRARVGRLEPRVRHRALVLFAAAPVAIACVLLLAVTIPALIAFIEPGLDHCLTHDDVHAHLCFQHLPPHGLHLGVMLGLVAFFAYGGLRATTAALGARRALGLIRTLIRTSGGHISGGMTVLATPAPICVTTGLWRPQVVISRGLLDHLDPAELQVLLAHERAHVRRRDPLVATLVRAFAFTHFAPVRAWLIRELDIAAEQACDAEAAHITGDRCAVAAAIISVERLSDGAPHGYIAPYALGFGDSAVERRVHALLSEPTVFESTRLMAIMSTIALAATLLFADELHHLTETVLSLMAH